jgi:hypothetical protein
MGGNEVVIVQILAVVLILFFCFVTYMNTKTWRATHVTFLFLVFGAALAFSVYASLILKTRKAWQKISGELELREEKATANVKNSMYGTDADPGLAAWREAVRRELIDRGRVWRDCAVVGVQKQEPEAGSENATVVVNLRTAPENDPGTKADYTKMAQNTIVYAFSDISNPAPPHSAYMYMGEFNATAVTDTSITLTSTSPLTPFDQAVIGDRQTWILYERMPADDYKTFSRAASTFHVDLTGKPMAVQPSDLLKVEGFNEGGTLLKDPQAHQKIFQEVLWEYQRDGMTEEQVDADRAAKMQEPLSEDVKRERLFAEVKFLKDHNDVEVDAGQAAPPDAGNSELFDSTGKALDPRLQRGSKISFKTGETAEMILNGARDREGVLLEKGAKELQDEGVLNIVRTIYRRPLNDYAYAFRHIYLRKTQVLESLALVNKEIAVVAAETAAAEKNTLQRQMEKTKLLEDQTKLTEERQKIAKYAEDLEASYRGVRAELSRLYRENAALHDQILAANEELTREIESRSGTPTALERD